MLFNVDNDAGDAIGGWLVLDNPGDTPMFRVSVSGREDHVFKANVFRRDLYDLGMHSTGMAGFHIDEHMIPGLPGLGDLSIKEATSGLPIYGRFDPETQIERKLLMIDTGVLPQIRSLQRVMERFAIRYPMVDRYSLESVVSILSRPYFRSVAVTGNVNWIRAASAVESTGFTAMALLRNPFEEMAEKFIVLKRLADQPTNPAAQPILEKYTVLLTSIQDMDMESHKSILSTMRNLNRDQRRLLRSPMTYAFGASPEEELQRRNVSAALDNLARFSLVGTRARFKEFAYLADSMLGGDVFGDIEMKNLPFTESLASSLAETGVARDLLDEDIALYSFAEEAVETVLPSKPDGVRRLPG
ncbi:hypothetical protein [Ensifer adhaerens]|uniref:hypothetical protein n=1 Tax=Ensifer adhaerens TaxID=106592 RepID=UPI000DC5F8D9|nr:hypothetical protein [Ensifer adhaerens]RAS07155.1 hypothetical protein DEU52_1199 [Ensifer adhaerens]